MLTTLHRVDQEINGLASGDFGIDSNDIPGTIGESLRSSVDHLARVTAQWQRSESFASAIVEQAADAIWAVDSGGVIRTANAASERLLEIDVDRQLGRSIYEFLPILSGETVVKGRPGVRVHVASNSVTDSDLPVTVIARDVSERARFEERLAHQARHDALTDLPNRFAVLERLEQLHERQESVAVLFIDIDGFKSVNDTRGHEAGDRVLTEIGRRLRSHVRPYDFVARLGGDEFVVLVRDIRRTAEALPFGERVIQQIEQPIVDDHSMFTLSASVGIALTDEALPALEAIRRADSAVYLAKRHGRGRVEVYDAALQASIEHDAELELALRHAIRSDELVLHYQPIVDLRTGEMCGVEALVRWERPGFGLIPPGDFVPVAERSSLIVDMQHWVLEEACATLASWHERDPYSTHTVAVNISGRHLIDGDLVGDLHQALDRTGADPGLLVFELTETHLLEDVDRATAVLNEIRRFGITISVDDFGTGYSSMTYLRDLPIDVIKIDRSFLAAAVREGRDEPLVDAMLTIGRNLHLKVVAEGVETERQLAYITERGCDYAQGWLFARAVPIDEAEAMLFGSSTPVLQPVAGA
jgi:diguanylate cyclase (GGDEF)-like protein